MAELDYVAILDAYKGLSICFIISITLSNCVLIFKTIQKGRFIYIPRSLILISLAIGDIFLALFGLVVLARTFFEGLSVVSDFACSTQQALRSYVYFLIHFVYGVGLIVLALEFVQRNRTPQPNENAASSIVKSIVYSAFPWISGLVIILPLTIANAYIYGYKNGIDVCAMFVSLSRLNAMYVVSVILPAIVSVGVCGAVMCVKLSPASYSSSPAVVTYQVPPHTVVATSHHTINVVNAAGPPQYPGGLQTYPINSTQGQQMHSVNGESGTSQPQVAISNDKPGNNNNQQIFTTPNVQYPAQQYPMQQYPVQQYPGQQYPIQQYPVQQQYPTPQYSVQYPPPQFPVQQQYTAYTAQPNVVYAPPAQIVHQQNTTVPLDPAKERKIFLIIALIFFICVVPYASFAIGVQSDTTNILGDFDSYMVAQLCLFWLSVSRSLVTPIIFIIAK
ncbi:unnamed protein product [Candidula unifasciata]|uniref:G-protein coupled receptors family 1 profile domain-containing protein n=1 Tax=Candidula unifasciata TaxID=100452 RepID=A0A8S3ZMB4_9EUPU|nr:unnamed protein product [Candidula unifasciata]